MNFCNSLQVDTSGAVDISCGLLMRVQLIQGNRYNHNLGNTFDIAGSKSHTQVEIQERGYCEQLCIFRHN
jgi:hypothetical protein